MYELLKLINSHLRHDVLNDLTTIRSILEVYRDDKDDELLDDVFKKIDGSANFLKEMREVESMVSEGNLKPVRFSDAIKPIKDKYEGYVNLNIQGDCTVMADDSLTSVFDNLVRNAITHGNADMVDINIENKGEVCKVEIADNGKGIPDDIRERVFEEGVSTNGTGLGLYIVKKTVERYGGSIHLDNDQQGATFILIFETTAQKRERRDSGISVLGEVGWGTHVCNFYQTKEDLTDLLIPFFKAGVDNNEYCMWVTSEFSREEAQEQVEERLGGLPQNMEVLSYDEWYTTNKIRELLTNWAKKLNQSLAEGYDGLRVAGDVATLDNFKDLIKYEEEVHLKMDKKKLVAVCAYPFDNFKTSEIADLTSRHHYTLVVREGEWELIENFEHKKTQKEMEMVEEKYRALVDNANEAIVVVQDGKIMYANPKAIEVSGYSKQELMFKSIFNFIHPEDREQLTNRYKERVNGKKLSDNYQFRFKDKGGNTRWAELNSASIEWDGKPATLNLITDITAQKEAEMEMERFLKAIETTKEAITILSPDERIIYANKALAELHGYRKDELMGKDPSLLNSGPHPEKVKKEIIEAVKENGFWEGELRNVRKDGSEFISYATITAVKDDDGEIRNFISTKHDITEKKMAEERIRKTKGMLQNFIDTSPLAIIGLDENWKVNLWNPAAEQIFGWSKEEVLGCDNPIVPEDKQEEFQNWHRQVLSDRVIRQKEVYRQRKDGSLIPVQMSTASFTDSDGSVNGMAIIANISERKKAEKELEEKSQEQRLLLDNMESQVWYLKDVETCGTVNKAHADFLGLSVSDVENKSVYDIFDKATADVCAEGNREVFRNKQKIHTEEWVKNSEGEERLLSVTKTPKLDDDGKVEYVICTAEDITERREYEKALRESEKKYRLLVENLNEGVWVIDKEGYTTFVNPRMAEILGYNEEEMLGKHLFSFMDEQGVEIAKHNLEKRKQGLREQHEFEFCRKDGSKVYTIVETSPIFSEDGSYVGAIAGVIDISELKKAQKRLEESEARYKATFEHTGTAMIVIEEDTTISMANRMLEELWSYGKEEVEGKKSWKEFVHPDDLDRMLYYHKARRMGEEVPKKYEFRLIDRGGDVRNILITIDVIPGTRKSVASLMDVTHIKRMNKLLEATSSINEVLARERNPETVLNAVSKNLKMLYEDVITFVIWNGESVPVKLEGVDPEAIKEVISNCPAHRTLKGEAIKISTDNELCQKCIKKEYKYALSIPLMHEGQQGIITIHSNSDFSEEELKLLTRLANNIGFALNAYKVEQDKVTAIEQLAKNLTQFDMAADRLRNPLSVIMSALELKDRYGKDEVIDIVEEQTERIKMELDELRKEESATHELLEQSKPKNKEQ